MDEEVKLLYEAIQVWNPDMDETDAICAAEAYFVESRFTATNPWQLLTYDILEIARGLPVKNVDCPPSEPQDAKVISMEWWRQERGR